MNSIETIFLRLYGYNLGRNSRNSPDAACGDAIRQLGVLLALPVVVLGSVVAILVPEVQSLLRARSPIFLVAVIALLVPGAYWATRRFSAFSAKPELADSYRSRRQRIKTRLGFFFFPLVIAALTAVCLRIVVVSFLDK